MTPTTRDIYNACVVILRDDYFTEESDFLPQRSGKSNPAIQRIVGIMREHGITLQRIAEWLNHRDISTIRKYETKWRDDSEFRKSEWRSAVEAKLIEWGFELQNVPAGDTP